MAKSVSQGKSFTSILDRPALEHDRPAQLPPGRYRCLVEGQPETGKSDKKGTEFYRYTLKPTEALEDVDEEALEEALVRKNGEKRQLGEMKIRATYWMSEDAAYRFTEFFQHCGLDVEGSNLRKLIPEATGCEIIAVMRAKPRQDGQGVYSELARTMPATDDEDTVTTDED